jgi:hypothetical protein
MMRKILGHPLLPGENYDVSSMPRVIEFRNSKMTEFSLKYLAKFVYENQVEALSINGGLMPLLDLK